MADFHGLQADGRLGGLAGGCKVVLSMAHLAYHGRRLPPVLLPLFFFEGSAPRKTRFFGCRRPAG